MVNRRERDTKFNNKSLKFQFLTHFHISGFYDAHKKRRQGCLCTMANTEVDDLCNHKAACLDYFYKTRWHEVYGLLMLRMHSYLSLRRVFQRGQSEWWAVEGECKSYCRECAHAHTHTHTRVVCASASFFITNSIYGTTIRL